jgi:diaminopimelate decarboxylase
MGTLEELHPSRAKARVDFGALTARLKSCPDTWYEPGRYFTEQTGEMVYRFDPFAKACRRDTCLGL